MHPGPEIGIRAGDLIAGKYRVDRILGVGGMGVVVAAHHLGLDDLVAIKVLLPEALADADAVRRFEREARAAVKIKSEHATRIIDVGTLDDGAPFIVMEYLAGEDLADRILRTGPMPVEDAIELVLQACEAIAEAHALGIVHRDLKPANLFCVQSADGRTSIKVLDFGISKFTHVGPASSRLGMTKTATMMGSPFYMSPEQMESPRDVDARTDIWSLGVVLYQLLTGEVPFSGETLPQVCVNVATRPAPPLRKLRPDVPSGLEAAEMRCLEKDPNKRYPTVVALATALGRFGPRRTQTSLDRITRTSRLAEAQSQDPGIAQQRLATDRPTTGPLPSWGTTAKSLESRTRNIIGWTAGVFVAIAVAFTWSRRDATTNPPPSAAVLVTPPPTERPREMATEVQTAEPTPAMSAPRAKTAEDAEQARSSPPLLATSGSPHLNPPGNAIVNPPPARPAEATAPVANPRPPTPVSAPTAVNDEINPYLPTPEVPKAAAKGHTCFLNLNSMPAARVLVDGTPLGFTPKAGVQVAPGDHRVLFIWADGDKHATVRCAEGETKTVAVRLYDPPAAEELPERNPYR